MLKDEIAELKMAKLTSAKVRAFRDRQAEHYAPATVVKRMNLLATIINHAKAEWDYPMGENPASAAAVSRPEGADVKRDRRLRGPKPSEIRTAQASGEPPPMSEEELLVAAMEKSQNPWDVWLANWAIASAFRQSETFALEWRDTDLDARTVMVHGRDRRGTKNQAKAVVGSRRKKKAVSETHGVEIRPLMPEAVAILKALPTFGTAKPGDKVFPAGDQKAFAVRFGRMVKRAGIVDLTYHDLRHEATSRLARVFTNPLDLKRVTGHRDLKSLDRYYQPNMSELAEVAEVAERNGNGKRK